MPLRRLRQVVFPCGGTDTYCGGTVASCGGTDVYCGRTEVDRSELVVQWIRRWAFNLEVVGSRPTTSLIHFFCNFVLKIHNITVFYWHIQVCQWQYYE